MSSACRITSYNVCYTKLLRDKEHGKYYTLGQERTLKRALQKITDVVGGWYPAGTPLRVQLLHGKNPEALTILRELMQNRFECHWSPTVRNNFV